MDGGFPFAVVIAVDFELLALAVVAGVADQDGVLLAVDRAAEALAVREVAGAQSRCHGGRRCGPDPLARAPLFFFFGFRCRDTLRLRGRLLGLVQALAQHLSERGMVGLRPVLAQYLSDLVDSSARQHSEPPFFFAVVRPFGEEPFFFGGVRLHRDSLALCPKFCFSGSIPWGWG